ncbi:GAF domain-containing sensor histidine kinase [Nannocystis pusilla]|uniref:histidine kinase n=1 Tax=Nannocystis pusilla TaxID=889268 RepID=A0A9X3IVK8_9BACT|nr:GAF domain-containing sensor histidine kinase [Nannocystis pusilla]
MPRKRTPTVAALLRLGLIGKDDWGTALQQALEISCDLIGVDRANYWSLRDDPSALVCELGYVASTQILERGFALLEGSSPEYFEAIREAQVLAIRDARADPRSRTLGAYLELHGISAMLDVPVFSQGRLAGILCHEHVGGLRRWSSREVELALTMSHILTSLLEQRARNQAEENERRAIFLAQASNAIAQTLDLREARQTAVRRALPRLGEMASLIHYDGTRTECVASAHVQAEQERLITEMCARYCQDMTRPGLAFQALRERQSLLVQVADGDAMRRLQLPEGQIDLLSRLRVRSTMSVLLTVRDAITGVLTLWSDSRNYDREDLQFAEAYAQQVSTVLENINLLARAQEALRARDEFLELAGHELRTPLTSLEFAVDLLRKKLVEPLLPAARNAVDTIARQATRLSRLTELVVLAPLHEGSPPLRVEPLDLAALVREVAREQAASKAFICSELEIRADAPVMLRGDRTALEVVVSNLLGNAMKFGAGRPIEVRVEADPDTATLSVRDHGIGIPPNHLPSIFQRYERYVSPNSFSGLGLGLYIAARLVMAHGGQIRADSRPGEGSTFTVELPV